MKKIFVPILISLVLALIVSALPLSASEGPGGSREYGYVLRYALLHGNRSDVQPATQASSMAATSRLNELLFKWDPTMDDAELRDMLKLRGLYEIARQAIELPSAGGESRGVFHHEGQRFNIEIKMAPRVEPDQIEMAMLIHLNGELVSAPNVISLLGQPATVATGYGEGSMMMIVVEAIQNKTRLVPSSADEIERVNGVPLADGEHIALPRLVHRMSPKYPHVARKAQLQGNVILRLRIGEDGHVRAADVLKPMPMGLTQAAIKAALQWRFETPMVDGEPSEVFGHYTITFRLNDTP